MKNNPTGAMGLPDYLGWNWKSKAGIPIVCIPGCPAQPDNTTETLLYLVLQLGGLAPMIDLDDALPPAVALRAHGARELQPRRLLREGQLRDASTATTTAASSSSAARARWSSATCRSAAGQSGIGGCPNVGGICMACTMPGFPDKYMPFMDEDTAGRARGRTSSDVTIGPIIRWARQRNIKNKYDKEPEWRQRGPAARHRLPAASLR